MIKIELKILLHQQHKILIKHSVLKYNTQNRKWKQQLSVITLQLPFKGITKPNEK